MRLVREGMIVETVNVNQWYWFPVTNIGHYVIVDADGTTVCNPSPMGQANAYLIAAAPDLLAALQRLVHPMADETDVENARDVIARATGAA